MSRSAARIAVCFSLVFPGATVVLEAQRDQPRRGSIVIATGADAPNPVPTVAMSGTNYEVAGLLFLRLIDLGPTLTTVGEREKEFTPALASSWKRRDSVTLAFELDSRALWHDGRPVTAEDVVFTFQRAKQIPDLASALRRVASVTAEGAGRVIVRFTRSYGEQLYDATYHTFILPEHLVSEIPPDSLASSAFARNPVGNGPFKWVRRIPGQMIELAAFDRFFLGKPGLDRVYFRVVPDADARINLLLSGEADAAQSLSLAGMERVRRDTNFVLVPVISPGITYALFNHTANGDRSKPHPILSDPVVRQALTLALDRRSMINSVYGGHASVPDGPVPQTFAWVAEPGQRIGRGDLPRARAMLASAGWTDADRDGVLEKNGVRFEITVNSPNVTPQRPMLAQQMQARFRELGVKLNIDLLEWGIFQERRNEGRFDMDMGAAQMDPTPSGWHWSWSCANAGKPRQNVGSYCNQRVDSLLERAASSRNPLPRYREILAVIRRDSPAIFLAAPSTVVAVHRRYRTHFRPESLWLSLRDWSVAPGRQIPRDLSAQ